MTICFQLVVLMASGAKNVRKTAVTGAKEHVTKTLEHARRAKVTGGVHNAMIYAPYSVLVDVTK